jgi:hypothetical protein
MILFLSFFCHPASGWAEIQLGLGRKLDQQTRGPLETSPSRFLLLYSVKIDQLAIWKPFVSGPLPKISKFLDIVF